MASQSDKYTDATLQRIEDKLDWLIARTDDVPTYNVPTEE